MEKDDDISDIVTTFKKICSEIPKKITKISEKDFQNLLNEALGEKLGEEITENLTEKLGETFKEDFNFFRDNISSKANISSKTKDQNNLVERYRKNCTERESLEREIKNLNENDRKSFWASFHEIDINNKISSEISGLGDKIDELLSEIQILRSRSK